MSATENLPVWSQRRRRVFNCLAVAITLAAAGMYAATGLSGYMSRGFDQDVFVSGAACGLFLVASVAAMREARFKQPAPG